MQEFIGAMVRFSTALTIYGIQQMRNGVSELVSTPMNIDRVREAMDSATNSLRSKIDESQKTTYNSVTTFSEDVLSRTCEAVRDNVADASQMLRNTGDLLRRSASVLHRREAADAPASEPAASAASHVEAEEESEPVRRTARRRKSSGGSGEPQPVTDVL